MGFYLLFCASPQSIIHVQEHTLTRIDSQNALYDYLNKNILAWLVLQTKVRVETFFSPENK